MAWLPVYKCIVPEHVVCVNVCLYCLLALYILPSPGLLGSGLLLAIAGLAVFFFISSGSLGLHTLLNYYSIVYLLQVAYAYMTVSAKTRFVCTIKLIFLFTQQYLQCPSNEPPKFQPSVVCSFGIIMLDSRKSKIIDLYSDYTENKLQALTFAAITSVWISLQCCNVA